MNIIYTLFVIVITLFINASISSAMPYLKTKYKALITTIRRVLKPNKSKPIPAVNNIVIDLNKRVEELEKKLAKRQENQRTAIRQEIKTILLELKNK